MVQRAHSKTKEELTVPPKSNPEEKKRRPSRSREERRAHRANSTSKKKRSKKETSETTEPNEQTENSENIENLESIEARQKLLLAILSKDLPSIPKQLEELKKHGITINYKEGKDRSTLLHRCAIQGGCADVIEILLQNNANINAADAHGRTALHISAKKGDSALLAFLLSKEANSMPKTLETQTPLHHAAAAGHLECLQILVSHHALLNLQDSMGYTALHLAVMFGHYNCAEFLVENNADVLSITKEAPPRRPIDVVPTIQDPKHKNKIIHTTEGKAIHKMLKKNGGNKTPHLSSGSMLFGGGNIRKSLDHRSTNPKKLESNRAGSIISASLTPRERLQMTKKLNGSRDTGGPVKFERKEELLLVDDETKIEEPEKPTRTTSDLLPDVKLDKYGFVIDESAAVANSESSKRQKKKNHAKEEERAMKWISIMQNDPVVDTSNLAKNKKILKLCDKGIPDTVRGQVWKYLAGVDNRDDKIYHQLLEEANWVPEIRDQIFRDINRTMPRHILFQEKGQGQTMLTNVLLAYSSYRPDVGYCQGMGFITAMFLMYLTEEDAFWLLDQLAGETYGFGKVWEEQMKYLRQCLSTYTKLLEARYPKVVDKYSSNGIPIQAFASQFFITGFMYNLPFDIATRLWDSFWLRNFDFLYATGVALVKLSKDRILGLDMEGLMNCFQFKSTDIHFTADVLVETAVSVHNKLKINEIRKFEKEYADAH